MATILFADRLEHYRERAHAAEELLIPKPVYTSIKGAVENVKRQLAKANFDYSKIDNLQKPPGAKSIAASQLQREIHHYVAIPL
jgi:hypothetical protein